jgi:hypothetical protein
MQAAADTQGSVDLQFCLLLNQSRNADPVTMVLWCEFEGEEG